MIEKNKDLICPIDGSELKSLSDKKIKFKKFQFPVRYGIPCLFVEKDHNSTNSSKLNNVKSFYTKYPFPNYNDFHILSYQNKETFYTLIQLLGVYSLDEKSNRYW